MQLRAYGPAAEDALAQAEAEIYRLEGVLSCRDEQAALARLNETAAEQPVRRRRRFYRRR